MSSGAKRHACNVNRNTRTLTVNRTKHETSAVYHVTDQMRYVRPEIHKLSIKIKSHFRIPGARRVKWIKFHSENPQFCSNLGTSLVSGASCSMQVKLYTFIYVRKNNRNNYAENFRNTVQNLGHAVAQSLQSGRSRFDSLLAALWPWSWLSL
jgi:hypothetical protein